MSAHSHSHRIIRLLSLAAILALLFGQIPGRGQAAVYSAPRQAPVSAQAENTLALSQALLARLMAAAPQQGLAIPTRLGTAVIAPLISSWSVPAAPDACSAVAGFDSTIDRTRFCVYYNAATTTNAQATLVADFVDDYWDRYETDFGFIAPLTTGTKLEIQIVSGGCNGVAWDNYARVNQGCFSSNEEMQHTVGHELFHRVQFNYDSDWNPNWADIAWFYEGTARMMEDEVFDNIDNWPGAMTAAFSFNQEVNNYLASTNNDVTSNPMRYKSALWWKYFAERYGSVAAEPEVGVDAIHALWNAVLTSSDIAAVNNALAALGAGTNFNAAFRRFTVANWTKGLTGLPDASYDYIDEKQAGNPAVYGPLSPATTGSGTISTGSPAAFNAQMVNRYSARYYTANISASACPAVTASFHRTAGTEAFYHVVTQKGTQFARHVEGSGADWQQSFLNDGITKIVAIAGSLGSSSTVDVQLSCADPVVDIKMPNSGAVAHPGPASAPGKFLAQVLVTNGSPTGPVVAGLTNADFKAKVNGLNALVTAGGFVQEQYWLAIQAPVQTANGTYDLEIDLEAPGTSTTIASDTNTASVTYDPDNADQVLVIDRSGSMIDNNKIDAAHDAANLYVDITRNNDGLAVVPFNHDINPAPFAMQSANLTVRTDAKTFINALTASGATSIGDGLQEAVNQRAASPTGNPRCAFVLLSDGMENTPAFYADVKAAVLGSNCPVTTIAFGPESDESLLQTIATDTGGLYFYNDVFVSIPAGPQANLPASYVSTAFDLDSVYEYAQGNNAGRQRLLDEHNTIKKGETAAHKVNIDGTVSEAVFTLDWLPQSYSNFILRLQKPDGTILDPATTPYDFQDPVSEHVGWRIRNPEAGEWQLLVTLVGGEFSSAPYQVIVSANSALTAQLLLPDRLGSSYFTGDRLPIYALLSGKGPISGALLVALVTAPDGTETRVQLFDDGQHNDGTAGDGLYGNFYTRTNQSKAVQPHEDAKNPTPKDEGSYRVRLLASGDQDGQAFTREALGAFAIQAGPDENRNGLPDNYEKANNISDANGDPDLDGLSNGDEYLVGTDPNNSDSDFGGENDGSEVEFGQNPLDSSDDRIEAPQFLHTEPENGQVVLRYDVRPAYTSLLAYRATSPSGPWLLQVPELPLTGVYSDTAANETTFYYKLMASNADNHRSAIIDGARVKPRLDPVFPEARVIIDHGAPQTFDSQVSLSFNPYQLTDPSEPDSFSDITEMLLSNDPGFAGADWQPFAQDIPWDLALTPFGSVAHVYARFRDAAGNETVGVEVGSILFQGRSLFIPMVSK